MYILLRNLAPATASVKTSPPQVQVAIDGFSLSSDLDNDFLKDPGKEESQPIIFSL